MDRKIENIAITAVADSDEEGFLAASLFNSGWQVQFRALDFPSLKSHLEAVTQPQIKILISTDLDGLSAAGISELLAKGFTIFLFTSDNSVDIGNHPVSPFPKSALELISLLRGSLRAPLLHPPSQNMQKVSARSIAVASVISGSGCTTVAINLAQELSLGGARVLLVDANPDAPAIATLIDGRGLRQGDEFANIGQNLWAMEITQASITKDMERLDRSQHEFDFILLDIGVIRDFPQVLTGKRWSGEAINWVSNNCDKLLLLSRSDLLSLKRLHTFTGLISQNPIKPSIKFLHMMRPHGKSGAARDKSFIDCISLISSEKVVALPVDTRTVQRAEEERATLYEIHERSPLRKVIAEMAGQLRG
jgi:hypothetical protein